MGFYFCKQGCQEQEVFDHTEVGVYRPEPCQDLCLCPIRRRRDKALGFPFVNTRHSLGIPGMNLASIYRPSQYLLFDSNLVQKIW